MNSNFEDFFKVKSAALPGCHAPAGRLSSEYIEDIVNSQLDLLRQSLLLSAEEHREFQLESLRNLLVHAGTHVPYYRKLFNNIGFYPPELRSLSEIAEIPLLSKEIIRENPIEFIDESVNLDTAVYMTTGGSTGDPLKILMTKEIRSKMHANTHFYMGLAGFKVGQDKSVRLHGNRIPDQILKSGRYWIHEGNRLTMSVYNISRDTVASYINAIADFSPVYIHAYASALSLLCQFAAEMNLDFPDCIKCVFCDSETLFEGQRALIERVTGATIFNTYGHTEACVLAVTMPGSKGMHVVPQVGHTELVDSNGAEIFDVGISGEIITTGFVNHLFPFIRYKTGDIASLGVSDQIHTDYPMVFENISGRLQDYIISRDGVIVPVAPLLFDYNFDWSGISRFQIHQSEPGRLYLAVMIDEQSRSTPNAIAARFGEMLGNEFKIDLVVVDQIQCTDRGKYRYVKQELDVNAYF